MSIFLKLKMSVSLLLNFIRQLRIRPFFNNVEFLAVNTMILFVKNKERFYKRKHELNTVLLKSRLIMPLAKDRMTSVKDYRIWTLWWQGENLMPPIVRSTIQSIKQASDKEVILITKYNYDEYIKLPEQIRNKVGGGISYAHLSDYIRISLLDEYGGLWIDSTVLCSKKIPDEIYGMRFFTVKDERSSYKFQSRGRWNCQVFGSSMRHYGLFNILRQLMENYWDKFDAAIDYLFFDSLIDWVLEENDTIMKDLYDIHVNNTHMHELLGMINMPYKDSLVKEWEKDTFLYKLTYKLNFMEQVNGADTFYKIIIKHYCVDS